LTHDLPEGWKALDQILWANFGLQEFLKEFLSLDRADDLAPLWNGDRYTIYEKKENKDAREDILVIRIKAANTGRCFTSVRRIQRSFRQKIQKSQKISCGVRISFHLIPTKAEFFLRCVGADCVTLEGGDLKLFDTLVHELGWPANPASSGPPSEGVKAQLIPQMMF